MADTGARAALDRVGDELLELPDVVGTAIGLDEAGREVIHLYVQSENSLDQVRERARRLLADTPVEVMHMEMPQAD
jgi:hypothetical protein